MVGAGQHEQTSGEQIVAGFNPGRPRARHNARLLGEQVTTATRERPQLGNGLVRTHACSKVLMPSVGEGVLPVPIGGTPC